MGCDKFFFHCSLACYLLEGFVVLSPLFMAKHSYDYVFLCLSCLKYMISCNQKERIVFQASFFWCYRWWKKSGGHQLRSVVYPIVYKVLAPSQVQDFFHQHHVSLREDQQPDGPKSPRNLSFLRSFFLNGENDGRRYREIWCLKKTPVWSLWPFFTFIVESTTDDVSQKLLSGVLFQESFHPFGCKLGQKHTQLRCCRICIWKNWEKHPHMNDVNIPTHILFTSLFETNTLILLSGCRLLSKILLVWIYTPWNFQQTPPKNWCKRKTPRIFHLGKYMAIVSFSTLPIPISSTTRLPGP